MSFLLLAASRLAESVPGSLYDDVAVDRVGAARGHGHVVVGVQSNLRLPRKLLERSGHFDLQVHFGFGPGGGLLDLVCEDYGAVTDDLI
jgi:hypothetical protein